MLLFLRSEVSLKSDTSTKSAKLVVYNHFRTSVVFQKLNKRPDGMVEMKRAA